MPKARSLRKDSIEIWQAGVDAVDASMLVKNMVSIQDGHLTIGSEAFPLETNGEIKKVVVVGFGKASGAMAVGFEEAIFANQSQLEPQISVSGLVCVPDDRVVDTELIKIVGGRPPGENLPTDRVSAATVEILDLIKSSGPDDICVCLISGGGSALLELPLEPITIDELRITTSYLSAAGASIYQLNAVRRAISRVKGGSLAAAASGTPIVSLIISDVIGDNLDVISSGPTVEPTEDVSAIEVLETFDPDRLGIPASVWEAIETKSKPIVKFGGEDSVRNIVIGNIETALNAAKEIAISLGYACELGQPSGNEGDAETIGRQIPAQVNELLNRGTKQCFIQGGETTVKLCPNPGHGGRNQHLVLAALDAFTTKTTGDLKGEFCLLSGGTDGEDGSAPETGIAGAIIDSQSVEQIRRQDTDEVKAAIQTCSSFDFHLAQGSLLRTNGDTKQESSGTSAKPTATNVCDLRIILTAP